MAREQTTTHWVAEDGTTHATRAQAEAHEQVEALVEILGSSLGISRRDGLVVADRIRERCVVSHLRSLPKCSTSA